MWISSFPFSSRLEKHKEGKQEPHAILSGACTFLWCGLCTGFPHYSSPNIPYLEWRLLICPWGSYSSYLSDGKISFRIQKLSRRARDEGRARASFCKQAFRDKEQGRHQYLPYDHHISHWKKSGVGALRWGKPTQRDQPVILPSSTCTPETNISQTLQTCKFLISCVTSFYLKSTFNTSIVSQIQVFTLYATKVFEYYSLYKMEPYKNTDNLMFLYSFL